MGLISTLMPSAKKTFSAYLILIFLMEIIDQSSQLILMIYWWGIIIVFISAIMKVITKSDELLFISTISEKTVLEMHSFIYYNLNFAIHKIFKIISLKSKNETIVGLGSLLGFAVIASFLSNVQCLILLYFVIPKVPNDANYNEFSDFLNNSINKLMNIFLPIIYKVIEKSLKEMEDFREDFTNEKFMEDLSRNK